MKRTLATAALALLAFFVGAAGAQPVLLPAQSEIGFTSRQMGVPVDGRFGRFDARISFDPKQPERARIAFDIDLASAQIGDSETMKELAKPAWFDSLRLPKATFESTAVKAAGAGRYEVSGKLSIKGQVREVVVPVTLSQSAGTTVAAGSFVLKRLEFRIGEGDWADTSLVANDVQVKFKLALSGIGAL
jgi:polyisoprenoid-binding protein YceI